MTSGTIDQNYYSAQLLNTVNSYGGSSSTIPYIFWNVPSPYNPIINDGEISGFLWGPLTGFISLNCNNTSSCASSDFKVINNNGKLSGYAWGENTGWISFSCANGETSNCASNGNASTSINTLGEFIGYAWSQNFGWIVFDCSNQNTCIKTDWRPESQRVSTSTSSTSNTLSVSGGSQVIASLSKITTAITESKHDNCKGASCISITIPDVFPEIKNTPSVRETIITKKNNTSTQETPIAVVKSDDIIKNIFIQDIYKKDSSELIGSIQVENISTEYKGDFTVYINKYALTEVTEVPGAIEPKQAITPSLLTTKGSFSYFSNANAPAKKNIIYEINAVDTKGKSQHSFEKGIIITLPVPKDFSADKKLAIYTKQNQKDDWKLVKVVAYNPRVKFTVNHLSYFKIVSYKENDNMFINALVYPKWYHFLSLLTVLFLFFWYTKKILKAHGFK